MSLREEPVSLNCGGACCRRFTLPWSFAELTRAWSQSIRRELGILWDDHGNLLFNYADIETIFDMVIPLGMHYWNPQEPDVILDTPVYHYTCRHLPPSGRCGIYPSRPSMCSCYPYGKSCRYKECQTPKDAVRHPEGGIQVVAAPAEYL